MNEEFKEKLEHHLKEELFDVVHYDVLAEEAEVPWQRELLLRTRNDEYRHAVRIREILKCYGYEIQDHPEVYSLWQKIKEL